jgi:hypothetical protein
MSSKIGKEFLPNEDLLEHEILALKPHERS